MKKIIYLFCIVLAAACEDDRVLDEGAKIPSNAKTRAASMGSARSSVGSCNEIAVIPLFEHDNGPAIGQIEWVVIPDSIKVQYAADGLAGWFLKSHKGWAGNCDAWPSDGIDYTHHGEFASEDSIRSFSFGIPLNDLPMCGCLALKVEIANWSTKYDEPPSLIWYEFEQVLQYCKCEEPDNKNLRTQTQGGWSSTPHGNNPGAYLYENFAAAFPNGLTVGCNHSITLTSAQAVSNALPQGGKPAALSKDYLNPLRSPKSVNNPRTILAGQVIALKLSMAFDEWDENFGESSTNLQNAVVTTGTFKGWIVAKVLAEAEKALGGCTSNYSPSQLNEVVTAINESFVDGESSTGFLMNGHGAFAGEVLLQQTINQIETLP